MIISGKGYAGEMAGAISEPHESELKRVVNELSLSILDLDKRIDLLASRLSPVIRNMPVPETAPEEYQYRGPCTNSPLGVLLMEKAAYVRGIEQRLAALLDALAL